MWWETGTRKKVDLADLESLADTLADRSKQAETALRLANYAEDISDYPSSLQAAQRAVGIAQETGDLEQEAAGQLAWGRALWRQWKYDQAKPKIEKALKLAKKIGNQQLIGHAFRNLGIIAGGKNDITLAIKYHHECLALYRKIGDKISELIVLSNLGEYYTIQFNFELALEYSEKNLATSREIGHKFLEGVALNNRGQLFIWLGEYEKAWSAYEQSLPIHQQIKNHVGLTEVFWGFSYISVLIHEDYHRVRTFAEEGISVAREAKLWNYEAAFFSFWARSLSGLGKWSEAEDLFEQSVEILIENDFQGQIKYTREGLARLYMTQGLIDRAVQQVDLILDDLEADGIVEGENRLVLVPLYICCKVLGTAKDPRFPEVLETAYNHQKKLAGKISNVDWQNSFLNNVPWNRGILEMWEAEQEN
jgi:tetratricopeptide (TPR) repeat protein